MTSIHCMVSLSVFSKIRRSHKTSIFRAILGVVNRITKFYLKLHVYGMRNEISERSAARLARQSGGLEAPGSNPGVPTIFALLAELVDAPHSKCGALRGIPVRVRERAPRQEAVSSDGRSQCASGRDGLNEIEFGQAEHW